MSKQGRNTRIRRAWAHAKANMAPGVPYTISDFAKVMLQAEPVTNGSVSSELHRAASDGELVRVKRGIYTFPVADKAEPVEAIKTDAHSDDIRDIKNALTLVLRQQEIIIGFLRSLAETLAPSKAS